MKAREVLLANMAPTYVNESRAKSPLGSNDSSIPELWYIVLATGGRISLVRFVTSFQQVKTIAYSRLVPRLTPAFLYYWSGGEKRLGTSCL